MKNANVIKATTTTLVKTLIFSVFLNNSEIWAINIQNQGSSTDLWNIVPKNAANILNGKKNE